MALDRVWSWYEVSACFGCGFCFKPQFQGTLRFDSLVRMRWHSGDAKDPASPGGAATGPKEVWAFGWPYVWVRRRFSNHLVPYRHLLLCSEWGYCVSEYLYTCACTPTSTHTSWYGILWYPGSRQADGAQSYKGWDGEGLEWNPTGQQLARVEKRASTTLQWTQGKRRLTLQ